MTQVAVFGATSEAFSLRNLNRTIDESLRMFAPFVKRATDAGLQVRGYISTVLGCPFQGEVAHDDVAQVTVGQGLANTLAAFEAGVTVADVAPGGIGWCPYSPGAKGNLVTEDLVWALDRSRVHTGVDLTALIDTTAWMADQPRTSAVSRAAQATIAKRDDRPDDPFEF